MRSNSIWNAVEALIIGSVAFLIAWLSSADHPAVLAVFTITAATFAVAILILMSRAAVKAEPCGALSGVRVRPHERWDWQRELLFVALVVLSWQLFGAEMVALLAGIAFGYGFGEAVVALVLVRAVERRRSVRLVVIHDGSDRTMVASRVEAA